MQESTKTCPHCGKTIRAAAIKCRWCRAMLYEPSRLEDDPALRLVLPVGRSGLAIAAGYLGLFAIIPLLGLPFAVGALVTGVLAIRNIRRDPHLHGMGRAIFGIAVGSLMLVVNALMIALLVVAWLVEK